MNGESALEVVVQARGDVDDTDRRYAQDKVGQLVDLAPGPVLFARVDLTAHADPARERLAFAKAALDVNGRPVRAHVAAPTMHEAVDLLEARLADGLERLAHHDKAKHLRLREPESHEWRHGDPSASRPSYFPRPLDEREIVRHKTFAAGEIIPDEAAFDLELLDHDFYLFRNRETGEDNLIARRDDSRYELFEPSATCTLVDTAVTITHSAVRPPTLGTDEAIDLLDLGDLSFVFFVDPETNRGRVAYRRYDGNYGVIVPEEESAS